MKDRKELGIDDLRDVAGMTERLEWSARKGRYRALFPTGKLSR
jgi:hypothetical protein